MSRSNDASSPAWKSVRAALLALMLCLLLAGCPEATKKPETPEKKPDAPAQKPSVPPPVALENLQVEAGVFYPSLRASLRNKSAKTIRAVSFWVTFKDGHGERATGLGDDEVANLIMQRRTIPPGETVRREWSLVWFDLAVSVDQSGICLVTFVDNTQWKPATEDPNC